MFFSSLIQTVPLASWPLMFSGFVIELDLHCALLQSLSVIREVPQAKHAPGEKDFKKGKIKIEVLPWVSRAK